MFNDAIDYKVFIIIQLISLVIFDSNNSVYLSSPVWR